jgi:hypothetical protein
MKLVMTCLGRDEEDIVDRDRLHLNGGVDLVSRPKGRARVHSGPVSRS